jgi:hypothetical protein
VSKTAAVVLTFVGFFFCSIPMSAQQFLNGLLPSGNVYAGVSYGQLTDVINQQSYRGFEGSFEDLYFTRFPRLGIVLDGSGYYRQGVRQYNGFGGFRFSANVGKWRPFVQAMAGIRHINSNGFVFNPLGIDAGGGVDYKLRFKSFAWRFQGDFIHSHHLSANQNDYRASTGLVWRF